MFGARREDGDTLVCGLGWPAGSREHFDQEQMRSQGRQRSSLGVDSGPQIGGTPTRLFLVVGGLAGSEQAGRIVAPP